METFDLLLPASVETTTGRWATVTDDSPLRIKVDGDTAALGFAPDTLVADLEIDDRVWVQVYKRRLVIIGKSGGSSHLNILDVYPVGAIYMSVVATSPATLFGGTWSALQNNFLVGAGGTYAVNATGGAATHTLTSSEMPAHTHGLTALKFTGGGSNTILIQTTGSGAGVTQTTDSTGSGAAHNNLPPYLAVYMWKRTA